MVALQQANPRLESLTNVISSLSPSVGVFAPRSSNLEGTLTSTLRARANEEPGPQGGTVDQLPNAAKISFSKNLTTLKNRLIWY